MALAGGYIMHGLSDVGMHNSSARWHYGARKGQAPEEFDDSGRSRQKAEAQNKTIARRFNEEV
jgi:hypothetical protein